MVGIFAQEEAAEHWSEDRVYVQFLASEDFQGGDG